MKTSILLIALLLSGCSFFQKPAEKPSAGQTAEVNIIPQPAKIEYKPGEFELLNETTIVVTNDAGITAANTINEALSVSYGFSPLAIRNVNVPKNSILLKYRPQPDGQAIVDESYEIKVEPSGVQITGTESGLFYGVQTLIQMIPVNVSNGIRIPAVVITDTPRSRYRGFHLDEARHFMGAEFVKKYIALAARYKLNYFHWHLTDDQGWRIPIEKYPLLTEVGSKRPETVKAETYLTRQPYAGDRKPVEAYYTRGQIKEIVAFAKAHAVTIIPEIEMPGHSSAALAAYHELGCVQNYRYKVQTTWGNPPEGFPEILCPSDETIGFLNDVLDEVMDMFPDSPYIHVGGDETNLSQWRSSKVVQDIKTREGFTDDYQVLKWFINQIAAHVESRGKKIICWDDMIEKGQYPNATIMSWKGSETAKLAALAGREVIITPYEKLYFDHPQSVTADEAQSFGPAVTLKSVFNFSLLPPKPTSEEMRNIIGGEGCVWTEFIEIPERAEYMAFPRLIALAEVLWTGGGKDYRGFITKRLFSEFARLDRLPDAQKVKYRIPEPFDIPDRALSRDELARIDLLLPIPGGRIYYTTDGSVPDRSSLWYTGGFIPVGPGFAGIIKAIVVRPDERISPVFEANLYRNEPVVSPVIPPRSVSVANPKSKSDNEIGIVRLADPVLPPAAAKTSKPVPTKNVTQPSKSESKQPSSNR